MLKVQTILAPTDFSHHAESALRYACGLAERLGATLHLLHILPDVMVPVGPDPSLISAYPPEYYQETEDRARDSLKRALDPSWEKPPAVETVVRWGDPVDVIVGYAAEKIDLIVIATHGRSGLSHVLLGSVAERIVREAPCPVLTIRNRETT
jgi:nucleotide-binding universal stress UspA family protein